MIWVLPFRSNVHGSKITHLQVLQIVSKSTIDINKKIWVLLVKHLWSTRGFEYFIHKKYQGLLQYAHKNTYEIHMALIQNSLGDDPIQDAIPTSCLKVYGVPKTNTYSHDPHEGISPN